MGDILPGSVWIPPPKASSEVHDVGGSKLSDCWRRRSERWLKQRQGAVLLDGVGHSDILLAVGQHGFHGFPNRRAAPPIREPDRFRATGQELLQTGFQFDQELRGKPIPIDEAARFMPES